MQVIVAQTDKILQPTKGTNKIMLPEFIWKNPNSHKILSLFDKTDIFNFKFRRTTAHFHKLGVSPFQYKMNKFLKAFYKITSYGVDANGKVFISGIEAKKYPFFGLHFQPETVPWNKLKTDNIINSTEAVRISQKFGNFFIQECRKNPNFLVTKKEFKALGGFNIRSKKIVKRRDNHYWFFNAPGFGIRRGQILNDWHNPSKRHDPSERTRRIRRLATALNKMTAKVAPPAKVLPRAKRPNGKRPAGDAANTLPPENRNVAGKNSRGKNNRGMINRGASNGKRNRVNPAPII
jgi:hypothetical protein